MVSDSAPSPINSDLGQKFGKVYVAGPMTGKPQFNYPAFDQAALALRRLGYEVTSPAEVDDPETRKAALLSPDGAPGSGSANGETWEDFLRRDIDIVRNMDGIVVLPGWETSKGATFEVDTANKLALWVRPFDPESERLGPPLERKFLATKCMMKWANVYGLDPLTFDPGVEVTEAQVRQLQDVVNKTKFHTGSNGGDAEVRVVDPKTGGAKGQKDAWLSLIPPYFKDQLSKVYKMGAEKYTRDNYLKGYNWSLSYDAMARHLDATLDGQWNDEESGLPHLAHVAWHCATLMLFEKHGIGTDDRVDFTGQNISKEEL